MTARDRGGRADRGLVSFIRAAWPLYLLALIVGAGLGW